MQINLDILQSHFLKNVLDAAKTGKGDRKDGAENARRSSTAESEVAISVASRLQSANESLKEIQTSISNLQSVKAAVDEIRKTGASPEEFEKAVENFEFNGQNALSDLVSSTPSTPEEVERVIGDIDSLINSRLEGLNSSLVEELTKLENIGSALGRDYNPNIDQLLSLVKGSLI